MTERERMRDEEFGVTNESRERARDITEGGWRCRLSDARDRERRQEECEERSRRR